MTAPAGERRDYATRLQAYLARYKREELGVLADGVWRHRGRDIPYPHILPAGAEALNVVAPIREEFWRYWDAQRRTAAAPASLHRYFAHLSSSQALAFNLFFPFLGSSRACPAVLLEALGLARAEAAAPIGEWRFEAVLDAAEGTNFDVAIDFADGRRLLVEVKLTEGEFGRCADDARHRRKREERYLPRLAGAVQPAALEPGLFFRHYQILRNVSYAGPSTRVLFLIPRGNAALAGGTRYLSEHLRPGTPVSVRYLEDVLAELQAATRGGVLAADVAAVMRKYGGV